MNISYFIFDDVQAEAERIRIAEEAKETELLSQALELSNQLSRYVNRSYEEWVVISSLEIIVTIVLTVTMQFHWYAILESILIFT